MDRRIHAGLYVLGGSLLGLAHPMVLLGPAVFVNVWTASLLGDALFIAGMVGTYYGARAAKGVLAVPAGLLGVWLTYAFAWMATGYVMGPDDAGVRSFEFVIAWGATGIVVAGFWPWAQRTLEQKATPKEALPELGEPFPLPKE